MSHLLFYGLTIKIFHIVHISKYIHIFGFSLFTFILLFIISLSLSLMSHIIYRYYAIVQPLDYPLIMTHRRVFIMLIIVWLAPALLSFLPICSGWYTTGENWRYLKSNPHVSFSFFFAELLLYILHVLEADFSVGDIFCSL